MSLQTRVFWFLALLAVIHSTQSCPSGFHEYNNGCYFVTEETTYDFLTCQDKVCHQKGGILAVVTSEGLNNFIFGLLGSSDGYIGLYESGADESGDWRWINGSKSEYNAWLDGGPDNWCVDEDCAVAWPEEGGWLDVSCSVKSKCVCQLQGLPSADFREHRIPIAKTPVANYGVCDGGRCFWMDNSRFRQVYLIFAAPCFLVVIFIVFTTFGLIPSSSHVQVRCLEEVQSISGVAGSIASTNYGFLVDTSNPLDDVDSIVKKWVQRGALGEIFYGIMLVALATTMMAHQSGRHFSILVDAFEAFILFVCKFAVGLYAHTVHTRMSSFARAVSGRWIFVLALSKVATALCALALCFVYIGIVIYGAQRELYCQVGYVFCWSVMLANLFQSLSGLALFRVYERAAQHVGDRKVFSKVVDFWWLLLLGGSFGVGIGLWCSGAVFVWDIAMDDIDPFLSLPVTYLVAAGSQIAAGVSMLKINNRVQRYFNSQKKDRQSCDLDEFTTDSLEQEPIGKTTI